MHVKSKSPINITKSKQTECAKLSRGESFEDARIRSNNHHLKFTQTKKKFNKFVLKILMFQQKMRK